MEDYQTDDLNKGNTDIVCVTEPLTQESPQTVVSIHLYKRRWFILFVYATFLLFSTLQWIQYVIIANLVVKYYNVSYEQVDWTSLIVMLSFTVSMLPACYLLDKIGLKWCLLISAGLTTIGAWVKVIGVSPNLFYMACIGQFFVGVGQALILGVSPRLATAWFGADEVSTASSIGLFGNQGGIAFGFLFPPLIVHDHENIEDIGKDMTFMFQLTAAASTFLFFLILFFFRERPALPPNPVQVKRQLGTQRTTLKKFLISVKRLLSNCNYCIMLIDFGIVIGIFNSICTLLNQLVLIHFENSQEFAGRVGLVITAGGTLGSIMFGIILDKTHSFRLTNIIACLLSFLFTIGFTLIIATKSHIAVYVMALLLGIFMGGYFVVGFEVATELTYPESESTAAGLLLIPPSILGIAFTILYSWLIMKIGDACSGIAMSAAVLVGTCFSLLIKPDYRRLSENRITEIPENRNASLEMNIYN